MFSFFPSFEERFVFTVGRCTVPSHTDEFSGALSLNLRKQSLQNGGKHLGETAADCNHLLSAWPHECWESAAWFLGKQTDSALPHRISMVESVLKPL